MPVQSSVGDCSVAELFTIGVGPSSSHTVGPMRAAAAFAAAVAPLGPAEIVCELFGSLAMTGKGHATDTAILLGLEGHTPEGVDPDAIPALLAQIRDLGALRLAGQATLPFREAEHLLFRRGERLAFHPNGMRFTARFDDRESIERRYYSIGGGAVVEGEPDPRADNRVPPAHPFTSARALLDRCRREGLSIAQIVLAHEARSRPAGETLAAVDCIRAAMNACIERGRLSDGVLPGGLGVRRRARRISQHLETRNGAGDPAQIFEWITMFAMAVNEENAAGGRVVTAPTNGAAGVIPAVLRYYESFVAEATEVGAREFLLTAAAIGFLYKTRASISAAEMGCQGEIGVACSMAAAGLAAALGGTPAQVENAAEVGMEHNLGLTCDPVGGLVQIPCIERNGLAAVKAVNAAYLALRGDGEHVVSLDAVIDTMRQTGEDMREKYRETSLGGLAVNVVLC